MSKTVEKVYIITYSTTMERTVRVTAENETAAQLKVKQGEWNMNDVEEESESGDVDILEVEEEENATN